MQVVLDGSGSWRGEGAADREGARTEVLAGPFDPQPQVDPYSYVNL